MTEPIFDETAFSQQVERVRQAAAIANATEPRAVLAYYDTAKQADGYTAKERCYF